MSGMNDDAEIDFGVDFDLDEQEPPRVEPPRVEQQEVDEEVAKLSDALYGPSGTGQAYGNIYTRNVPMEDLSNARRKDIIAKGKRSRNDYVSDDYDAAHLHPYHEAWRDAEDVLTEQKMQEPQTKKRKRGGGKGRKTNTKTKSKKSKKHRKNKSRKSRRVSHKK